MKNNSNIISVKRNLDKNDPFDYYETPDSCIQSLINEEFVNLSKNNLILDFCVGRGQILKNFIKNNFNNVFGCDIRDENIFGDSGIDFLNKNDEYFLDKIKNLNENSYSIVMNPPFNKSYEFINRSLSLFKNCDIYIIHRLEFIASITRKSLMNNFLKGIFVLKRPTLYPGELNEPIETPYKPKTGGAKDYAWLLFNTNKKDEFIKFKSL